MCRRVAGEDGTVDFETLPAGRYLLTTGAEGMLLQLEGPAEIRFEGRTLDALEVEFAPGAPDRRLGLRSGDVIVGAGGKPFASLDDARLKLRDAAATLLVRREGTTTEVGVDLGELRRALEAGELSITPTLR
jgi:S1-C subfamily serine protease